jgi:hypothetical protein
MSEDPHSAQHGRATHHFFRNRSPVSRAYRLLPLQKLFDVYRLSCGDNLLVGLIS